jgi:hypothetical protein
MALALIATGILLMVAAVRGTQGALFSALAKDIPGYWRVGLALTVCGMVGFLSPKLKPVAIGLMCLVLLSILEQDGTNVFSHINKVIAGQGSTASS